MDTLDLMGNILTALMIAAFVLLCFAVGDEIRKYKEKKKREKFIDSIAVGDVFDTRPLPSDDEYTNPFDERKRSTDPLSYVTIVDLKKNKSGRIFVQYVYGFNPEIGNRYSESMDSFVKYKERVDVDLIKKSE